MVNNWLLGYRMVLAFVLSNFAASRQILQQTEID
jgi:hypothetical protein